MIAQIIECEVPGGERYDMLTHKVVRVLLPSGNCVYKISDAGVYGPVVVFPLDGPFKVLRTVSVPDAMHILAEGYMSDTAELGALFDDAVAEPVEDAEAILEVHKESLTAG